MHHRLDPLAYASSASALFFWLHRAAHRRPSVSPACPLLHAAAPCSARHPARHCLRSRESLKRTPLTADNPPIKRTRAIQILKHCTAYLPSYSVYYNILWIKIHIGNMYVNIYTIWSTFKKTRNVAFERLKRGSEGPSKPHLECEIPNIVL